MWPLSSSGLAVDACFIVMLAGVAVWESVRVLRRSGRAKSFGRSLTPHRRGVFVPAKPSEGRVPEVVLGSPRKELDLDDDRRAEPDSLAEVLPRGPGAHGERT